MIAKIKMPGRASVYVHDAEQWRKGWQWAVTQLEREGDAQLEREAARRLVGKAAERQAYARRGRMDWKDRRDYSFWTGVFDAAKATQEYHLGNEGQEIDWWLAEASDPNLPYRLYAATGRRGVLGDIKVFKDGSGAVATLTYKQFTWVFDCLGQVTVHRRDKTTGMSKRTVDDALRRATAEYHDLLELHTDEAWRNENAAMYADRLRGNPARERAIPPMPRDWWAPYPKQPDEQAMCYRTKTDALLAFLAYNWRAVEEWGGLDRADLPSEFDAINAKYGLKGRRQVRTLAQAAWWSLPGPAPWCLDKIDVELLNATSPGIHAQRELGVGFELPDYAAEEALAADEEAYFAAQGEKPPVWHCVFPTEVVPF